MSTRAGLRRLHPLAGLLATAIILAFWTTTADALLVATPQGTVSVKHTIGWCLILLIPALATTGATGFLLGHRSQDPRGVAKQRRMLVIRVLSDPRAPEAGSRRGP